MKIRIKGNSIRLRLTQNEVKNFGDHGSISEQTQFGSNEKESLIYTLKKERIEHLTAVFEHNEIKILVPFSDAANWVETEQVGIENSISLNNTTELKILIEKDFKCLSEREGEDESDSFPHP